MGKLHKPHNLTQSKEATNRSGNAHLAETSMEELYRMAEEAYQQAEAASNSDKLMSYMITKGTLKDRLSALSSQINSHPQLSLRHLTNMVSLCKNNENRKEAVAACEHLKDVFMQSYLSTEQKLRYFSESVSERLRSARKDKSQSVAAPAQLLELYVEHKVKHLYAEYLKCLEGLMADNLYFIKKTCLQAMVQLAKFPQMQNTILSALVNKFGDSDMQVVNELTKMLREEVSLDFELLSPLLRNIEEVLFRKNISRHAQFYCVNLLTNLSLRLLHEKHLNSLMELYFKLFRKLVVSGDLKLEKPAQPAKPEKKDKKGKKKKGDKKPQPQTDSEEELSSKLFLNVIKGLNKLFPLVKGEYTKFGQLFEEKVDSLYRIVHSSQNCKVKVQLLLFLYQSQTHLYKQLPDRYYRCLYDFLNEPQLSSSSLLELFFDLLLISLKQDTNLNRVMAFMKRLFQICFQANPNFIITCLILFSKLQETHPGLQSMLARREHFLEEEGEVEKYDMFKRDPLHSKAQNSCLWELSQLRNHYHPSIRKFVQQLFNGEPVNYNGNPLIDFGLTNFIEKLCLRSQRKSDGWKLKNKRVLAHIRPSKYESILQKPLEDLNEDEAFLHKYLQRKKKISENRKKVVGDKDIEQYADEVIEKEMERINGKEDDDQGDYDDDDQEEEPDIQDQENEDFDYGDLDGQELEEEDIDEDEEQPEEDEDEMDAEEDILDRSEDDEDDEENQGESQQKDFNEVFDNIGQEQRQARKAKRKNKKVLQQGKTKLISKQHNKGPSKNSFKGKNNKHNKNKAVPRKNRRN